MKVSKASSAHMMNIEKTTITKEFSTGLAPSTLPIVKTRSKANDTKALVSGSSIRENSKHGYADMVRHFFAQECLVLGKRTWHL